MDDVVEGVQITRDGEVRQLAEVCRDFVREQAQGEWGAELERRDADKMTKVMQAFMRAATIGVPPAK